MAYFHMCPDLCKQLSFVHPTHVPSLPTACRIIGGSISTCTRKRVYSVVLFSSWLHTGHAQLDNLELKEDLFVSHNT